MSEATTGVDTALRRDVSLGASETIRSPEQVALDLPIAGPMSRLIAFSFDYLLILLVEVAVFVGLLFLAFTVIEIDQLAPWFEDAQVDLERGVLPSAPWVMAVIAIWIVLEFVLQWAYFVASELLMQGRSFGKSMVGLRVVREGGLPITLRESMTRNLLRVVDMLPTGYFLGFVTMVVTEKTRRLGDIAAGTIVVRDHKPETSDPIEIDAEPAPGAPAFRFDSRELAAIGPVERRLIRQTLRRVETLPAWSRKRVMTRTVEALRSRMGHPEEIAEPDQRAFLQALLRDADR